MKKKFTLVECVFIFSTAVALGFAFWAYTIPYKLLSPILKVLGINGICAGFYHMAGPMIMYILRKPGCAFLGELIAATISGCISQWGLLSILSGLFQGLGSEFIFFITRYKYFNYFTMILASISSVAFGYCIYYWFYYRHLSFEYNIIRFSLEVISSIFLSGILSKKLGDRLANTGALNQFAIVDSK